MTELFRRDHEVVIDTIKLTEHRIAFEVEKTLKPEPNVCQLAVWNLTEDQRASLEELTPKEDDARGVSTKIEAGYNGDKSQIWLGDLRTVDSVRDGADWVTVMTAGDGEKAYAASRLGVSYGPKTDVGTALRAMVRAMGIGDGNVTKIATELQLKGASTLFSGRTVLHGPTAKLLHDFAKSADLEWSIQDGAMQFVNRGKVLEGLAVVLSPETGLIGSPTVDNEGVLSVQMLMIPDVKPGGLLVVNSRRISGTFRIEKLTWTGDTHGGAWYILAEAKKF